MIPEKIYIDKDEMEDEMVNTPNNDRNMVLGVNRERGQNDIEYTLSPTIKKFADEKPNERGLYLFRYSFSSQWVCALYNIDNDSMWLIGDNKPIRCDEVCEWCEIILP